MSASDKTIFHELLTLTKTSNERDSRIESKMNILDVRMKNIETHAEKQDEQIEKLTEILADQKMLSHNLTEVVNSVDGLTNRVTTLEKKSGEIALSIWKKIFAISGSVIITAIVTYFIGKLE